MIRAADDVPSAGRPSPHRQISLTVAIVIAGHRNIVVRAHAAAPRARRRTAATRTRVPNTGGRAPDPDISDRVAVEIGRAQQVPAGHGRRIVSGDGVELVAGDGRTIGDRADRCALHHNRHRRRRRIADVPERARDAAAGMNAVALIRGCGHERRSGGNVIGERDARGGCGSVVRDADRIRDRAAHRRIRGGDRRDRQVRARLRRSKSRIHDEHGAEPGATGNGASDRRSVEPSIGTLDQRRTWDPDVGRQRQSLQERPPGCRRIDTYRAAARAGRAGAPQVPVRCLQQGVEIRPGRVCIREEDFLIVPGHADSEERCCYQAIEIAV